MKDDPRSKYPMPPFQEQKQAWPGLAAQDDSETRSWRDELERVGPAEGPQSTRLGRKPGHSSFLAYCVNSVATPSCFESRQTSATKWVTS
jgi:hypothetical protein